jgi:hypothetical protein
VSKHIAKNPKKYAAGATAVAGAGIYNEYVKGRDDGTHAKIKKHLKSKGVRRIKSMKIVSQAAKIFLKHKKRKPKTFISKAGSFVKKEAKDLYRFSKENPLLGSRISSCRNRFRIRHWLSYF